LNTPEIRRVQLNLCTFFPWPDVSSSIAELSDRDFRVIILESWPTERRSLQRGLQKIRPLRVTVQQRVHVGFLPSESVNLKAIRLIPSWIFKSISTGIAEAY
jgi:hypothetical protein